MDCVSSLWKPGNLLSNNYSESEHLGSVPQPVVWAVLKAALPSTQWGVVLGEAQISQCGAFPWLAPPGRSLWFALPDYQPSPEGWGGFPSCHCSLPGDKWVWERGWWGSLWKAVVGGTGADAREWWGFLWRSRLPPCTSGSTTAGGEMRLIGVSLHENVLFQTNNFFCTFLHES